MAFLQCIFFHELSDQEPSGIFGHKIHRQMVFHQCVSLSELSYQLPYKNFFYNTRMGNSHFFMDIYIICLVRLVFLANVFVQVSQ
jgi:hypothetical protein